MAGWLREASTVPTTRPASACEVAGKYSPDRAWCVDVCRTRAGNYYLLEIGCFSCAGLYECDLSAVVSEVSRVSLKEWENLHTKSVA